MAVQYVQDVPSRVEEGQIWKVGGFPQTALCKGETTKSYKGLGGSREKAEEALLAWQSLGFKGNPVSAVSFYRAQFERMKYSGQIGSKMYASFNNYLRQGFYGGWIEVMKRGYSRGPLFHYDLNKAYYWAGSLGLPLSVRSYVKGDSDFMVLARILSHARDLPVMIENRARVLLTNEDIELYDIDAEIFGGVSWDPSGPLFYPETVMAELAGQMPPALYKTMLSMYWGIYAQHLPVEREIYKGGNLTKTLSMNNRLQNVFWAQTIISRVTRRVYTEAVKGARQVYVDSIISDHKLPTGSNIGQWRLCNEFPKGVLIKAPGVWTAYPIGHQINVNQWYRHAGYSDIK